MASALHWHHGIINHYVMLVPRQRKSDFFVFPRDRFSRIIWFAVETPPVAASSVTCCVRRIFPFRTCGRQSSQFTLELVEFGTNRCSRDHFTKKQYVPPTQCLQGAVVRRRQIGVQRRHNLRCVGYWSIILRSALSAQSWRVRSGSIGWKHLWLRELPH